MRLREAMALARKDGFPRVVAIMRRGEQVCTLRAVGGKSVVLGQIGVVGPTWDDLLSDEWEPCAVDKGA